MIPVGYMLKNTIARPEWVAVLHVVDIYSVSGCHAKFFTDYIKHWKHNGFWFFDSPKVITEIAAESGINTSAMTLFFYEAYENEFDLADDQSEGTWSAFSGDDSFPTAVEIPAQKRLVGYDVVEYSCGNSPEASPLSCNSLAQDFKVNEHCLFNTFQEAKEAVETGKFNEAEPGPYRILAVYCLDSASSTQRSDGIDSRE